MALREEEIERRGKGGGRREIGGGGSVVVGLICRDRTSRLAAAIKASDGNGVNGEGGAAKTAKPRNLIRVLE